MKKIFVDSMAALVIAGIAIKKFRKWIVGGIATMLIVGFATFNVILSNDLNGGANKFSSLTLANLIALSDENENGENGGSENGGSPITPGKCFMNVTVSNITGVFYRKCHPSTTPTVYYTCSSATLIQAVSGTDVLTCYDAVL
jgi:hypothetical protein